MILTTTEVNYDTILEEIRRETAAFKGKGELAKYIPELAAVNPDKFGICIRLLNGEQYAIGDYREKFSIQSISKVLALSLAFSKAGENIWSRVGVEPSGNAFNSLVQLEYEKGIPRNPFINAGALVICDLLLSHSKDAKEELLSFIRNLAEDTDIHFNPKVADSEKAHGNRNAALAHFLKSFRNLENDVETVLDLYFHMCSIEMSCEALARTFLLFVNHGDLPHTRNILTRSQVKRLNALMQTCGFYDEAGEFSFKVGLPGKSGVGGGIVAIHPGEYSVAVWGPRLNEKGNSVMGMKALELLTTKLERSIF